MNNVFRWRSRLKTAAAYFVLGLMLPGCGGCPPVTLKTIELQPVDMATGVSGVQGSIGWCLSAGNQPPSAYGPPGPGQVMVGYDDFFQPGAPPFPCNGIRDVVFRGGVLFDLSQFDSIVSADLLFDTQYSVSNAGGEPTSQNPPASYATTLGVGTQAFSPEMPDDNEASLQGIPTPSLSVGVSGTVRDWISNNHPNFGFILWGPRGLVDPNNPPEDNDTQISWYGNFRLRIIYNPAQNPRAPQ